jgi:hypothetical protein
MSPVELWSTNEGQQITLNHDRNEIVVDGGVPPNKPTTFFSSVRRSANDKNSSRTKIHDIRSKIYR